MNLHIMKLSESDLPQDIILLEKADQAVMA